MGFLQFQKYYKKKRAQLYTALIRRDFGHIGAQSLILPPFHSNDVSRVYIGAHCCINENSWIDCVKGYAGRTFNQSRIDIGDGAYIGNRAHIIACLHMRIGRNVVLADGVYITDNLHGFEDVTVPVMQQPLVCPGEVVIDDEVWLGEGVCVLPNVTIGRHSIIGSNSVVTKDIPAYSVAVGVPAKVIKYYDFDARQWKRK